MDIGICSDSERLNLTGSIAAAGLRFLYSTSAHQDALMREPGTYWLSGFLNAGVQKAETLRRLVLDVFLPFSAAFVTVRLLDRNLQEVEDNDGRPVTLCELELLLNGPMGIPAGPEYQRPRELFGRERQFYCRNITVNVPAEFWRESAHVAMDIAPLGVGGNSAVHAAPWQRSPEQIYLEMSRRKLNSFRTPILFLLISKAHAARRIERIIQKQPVLLRREPAVMVGLSSMMVKSFRGGDCPLLTEEVP